MRDILSLADDWQEHTRQWMSERPTSVRKTFNTPDKDEPTQTSLILYLLDQLGYPDVHNLTDDFKNGFDMVGDIKRGPGGRPRSEDKYQSPMAVDKLRAASFEYV